MKKFNLIKTNNQKAIAKEKGITLIALVITIIIILILAGISISALSGKGIFENANRAKLNTKRAQIEEWLKLKVMEEQTNNPTGTSKDIIGAVRNNVDKDESKKELLKIGKTVIVDQEINIEEDGNAYFYLTVDDDKYKVDLKEQKFIEKKDPGTETDIPKAEGIIKFSPATWENGKASTTISVDESYKKYKIQYQLNDIDEAKWIIINSGESITEIQNGYKLYARLWDGTKGGDYTMLSIEDKTPPSAAINLSATSTKVASELTASVELKDNQSGVNISECKWIYNTNPEDIGTDLSDYSEEFKNDTEDLTLKATTIGDYYLHILTVDNVGNKKETKSNKIIVEEEMLSKTVEVGDYVKYDATDKYEYESQTGSGSSSGNGDTTYKFKSSSEINWRVLSKDESTGEVVLTSESSLKNISGANLAFNRGIGYLYAEEELNKICSIYGHGIGADTTKEFEYVTGDLVEGTTTGKITGSGARSITIEDINKITGFKTSDYNDIEFPFGEPYTHTIFYPTKKTEKGESTSALERTDVNSYYKYSGSDYLEGKIWFLIFGTPGPWMDYWCSTRMVKTTQNISLYCVRICKWK